MEQKVHSYKSDEITVTYDVKRCIHARECVKGLKSVFDPQKRPWIQPGNAGADTIMEVIERCPTGALHYRHRKEERMEQAGPENCIRIVPDGPLYVHGDIELKDENGQTLLRDFRMAVCRCGHSNNKPLCDGSHKQIGFKDPASFDASTLEANTGNDPSPSRKLTLKAIKDGPMLVRGTYLMESPDSQTQSTSKNIALCRCGGSDNKPFCDGTHKKMGFESH